MRVSGIDESRLSVLLDVRQPQAYLALHPAAALGNECGIEFNWLPVAVESLKAPTQPGPDDDRGILHRRSRARAIAREIETYAAAQGLELEGYYRDDDPAALNLVWLWVRERHPEQLVRFLEEAFRAWWARELDISSVGAVGSVLDRCGIDDSGLSSWREQAGPELAAALEEELHQRGIARAPCYFLEDEVFIGRQHLPMIRWILAGRSGPGPI
jgi:2-hydroxychromene-2-carboxylate isomerase